MKMITRMPAKTMRLVYGTATGANLSNPDFRLVCRIGSSRRPVEERWDLQRRAENRRGANKLPRKSARPTKQRPSRRSDKLSKWGGPLGGRHCERGKPASGRPRSRKLKGRASEFPM